MPWNVPQGYSIDDLLEELNVDIITIPEVPTALNVINQKIRKVGLAPMVKEETFGVLMSAIFHYQKLKDDVTGDLWDVIDRGYRDNRERPDQDTLMKCLFLSCQLMDQTIKKSSAKVKDTMIELFIKRWIKQLEIIGRREIHSPEAASMIMGVCWQVLGSCKKNKSVQKDITEIISKVIKTVGSQEVAINIVKFIQKDESLAEFFAERVVTWIIDCEARGLVNSILCEINEVKDVKAQKGLVDFMGSLAKKRPQDFIRHFSMTVQLIAESDNKYWIREACLNIMSEIYMFKVREEDKERDNAFEADDVGREINQSALADSDNEEESSDLDPKQRSFMILTEHIHDRNAYTRSFAMKIFEKMIQKVPLPHIGEYQEKIVGRFDDNTSTVRKSAMNAFIAIINNNRLLDQLKNPAELRKQVDECEDPEVKKALVMLLRDCEKLLDLVKKGSEIVLNNLLHSNLTTDVIEAINWFYQITTIGIDEATLDGFRQMATHVWNKEEKIREKVLCCYKDVYFNDNMDPKRTAFGLIYLVAESSNAEAFSIGKMVQSIKIPKEAKKLIWKYALGRAEQKMPPHLQAAAMAIICMTSKSEPEVLTEGNIDAFVYMIRDPDCPPLVLTEVFGVLTNLRPDAKKPMPDGAFDTDHDIFEATINRIYELLKKNCGAEMNNMLFAAIKLIYYLANPSQQVSDIVSAAFKMAISRLKKAKERQDNEYTAEKALPSVALALNAAGHHALNLAIWAECTVVPKLTEKTKKKKGDKTPKDDDDLDDIFGNIDDAAYEEENIIRVLNYELNRGPFKAITAFAKSILVQAGQWPSNVQCAAINCLMKFMAASADHAESHSRLIFTILQKAENVSVEQTILSAFPDLLVRHPNIMDTWVGDVFDKLEDHDDKVRASTLTMISDLIVKDLVKPRGRLYQVARLVLDPNPTIKRDAKTFFVEFSSHGTKLINNLPDILAKLHELQIVTDDFKEITTFLFDQLSGKEKQTEQLVEKLCSRFREQDAEDTWKQVALTISVMPVNERMIKKLSECAFMFQDKVSDLEIRDNLHEVCNKARENTKLMQKLTSEVDELEQVILGDKTLPVPQTPVKKSQRGKQSQQVPGSARKGKVAKKTRNADIWSSDEDDGAASPEEEIVAKRSSRSRAR